MRACLFAGAGTCVAKRAQSDIIYPVKQIRIIVAASPGAAGDFFARSLGDGPAAFYQKRVVIENRPIFGPGRIQGADS